MDPVRIRLLDDFPRLDEAPADLFAPAHEDDVGIDLYAAEDAVLRPGERAVVGTGLQLALPAGHEAQVRPRSGNAARLGLTVLNTPGTIDPGYRGEVKVICQNANAPFGLDALEGIIQAGTMEPVLMAERLKAALEEHTIAIARGQKLAQLVFARFERPELEIVGALEDTERGAGGLGSTGTVGAD